MSQSPQRKCHTGNRGIVDQSIAALCDWRVSPLPLVSSRSDIRHVFSADSRIYPELFAGQEFARARITNLKKREELVFNAEGRGIPVEIAGGSASGCFTSAFRRLSGAVAV